MEMSATTVNRRKWLAQAGAALGGLALRPSISCFASAEQTLTVRAGGNPVPLSGNFIGLGYEMSSVATPGLLSAGNQPYIALVKGLGPAGVIRVGGIVADYTRYEADGVAKAERQDTVITQASIAQFAGFLHAIGWSAIWSLNFAQGTMQEAVEESRAVAHGLGDRLQAFEIGNEVENYARGQKPFRQSPYTYEAYRAEYSAWHDAISKAVPDARFAAPDTAGSVEWVERMAEDAHGDVQLLTTHYYRNGQSRGSVEQLLLPDPSLANKLARLRAASQKSGIPWRMCETNSFSGGGLPGVSDTFVGALWTLEFMLRLAQSGCAGVNLETGVNQLGFISSYSPITDDGKGMNTAGVPYYGMLAFATARRGNDQVIPIEFDAPNESVTAYALGRGDRARSLVAVNRSRSQGFHLDVLKLGVNKGVVLRLEAPSSDSKERVTFGGESVNPRGDWKPRKRERLAAGTLSVPAMSAAVVISE